MTPTCRMRRSWRGTRRWPTSTSTRPATTTSARAGCRTLTRSSWTGWPAPTSTSCWSRRSRPRTQNTSTTSSSRTCAGSLICGCATRVRMEAAMGRDIQAIKISGEDRRKYRDKVRRSLDAFARMLRERLFDDGASTVGQEIELNLTDEHGMPSMRNSDVLDAIASPAWATEVGQFNLEINIPPRTLDGDALATLETELRADLDHADTRARTVGSHLVMVGILPTLAEQDVAEDSMSANERYKVLNEQIFAARGEDMRIEIDGAEQLLTHM